MSNILQQVNTNRPAAVPCMPQADDSQAHCRIFTARVHTIHHRITCSLLLMMPRCSEHLDSKGNTPKAPVSRMSAIYLMAYQPLTLAVLLVVSAAASTSVQICYAAPLPLQNNYETSCCLQANAQSCNAMYQLHRPCCRIASNQHPTMRRATANTPPCLHACPPTPQHRRCDEHLHMLAV